MLRIAMIGLVALGLVAGVGRAADKEVTGTLVKVDHKDNTLTVKTADGEKTYDVNAETKFVGPKGGAADAGLKDERLVKGVMLKLVIAGNNKTAREVHIPERKKAKDK
jgi:FlaG/FlaF family flagellin (archaellin)